MRYPKEKVGNLVGHGNNITREINLTNDRDCLSALA